MTLAITKNIFLVFNRLEIVIKSSEKIINYLKIISPKFVINVEISTE